MKRFIRNSANFKLEARDMEYNTGQLVTVPDESMSVRDIVERFTKGSNIPMGNVKEPSYVPDADFDSEDLEKVKNLDLHDLQEYREEVARRAYAIEAELKQRKSDQDAKDSAHNERVKRALDLLDSEESDNSRSQGDDATGRRRKGGRATSKGRLPDKPDAD